MTTTTPDNEARQLRQILADLLPILELSSTAAQPDRLYCTLGPLRPSTADQLRARIAEALTDPDQGLERIVLAYLGSRIEWQEIGSLPLPCDDGVLLWRDGIGVDIGFPGLNPASLVPNEVTHWAPLPAAPDAAPTDEDRSRARRLIAEVRNWATIEPGVQVVDLQPDDVLIARLAPDCTAENARHIADALQARFDRPVVILANGAEIEAVPAADFPAHGAATTTRDLPLGLYNDTVPVTVDPDGWVRITPDDLEEHLNRIHAARRAASGLAAIGDEALRLLEHGLEMEAGTFRLQRGRLLDKARRNGAPAGEGLDVRAHAFPADSAAAGRALEYVVDAAGTLAIAAEIFEAEILPALDLAARIRTLPDYAGDSLDATVQDLACRHAVQRAQVVEDLRAAVAAYLDAYTGP